MSKHYLTCEEDSVVAVGSSAGVSSLSTIVGSVGPTGGGGALGFVTIITKNFLSSMLYDSRVVSSWRILPEKDEWHLYYSYYVFNFCNLCISLNSAYYSERWWLNLESLSEILASLKCKRTKLYTNSYKIKLAIKIYLHLSWQIKYVNSYKINNTYIQILTDSLITG